MSELKIQEVLELVTLGSKAEFRLPTEDMLRLLPHHRVSLDLEKWNELGRPARITVTLEKHS